MIKFTERMNRLELDVNRWKVFLLILLISTLFCSAFYHAIFVRGIKDPVLLYVVTPLSLLLIGACIILSYEKTRWIFDLNARTARWEQKFLLNSRSGSLNFQEIERVDLQKTVMQKTPSQRLTIILKSRPDKPFPLHRCWEGKENFTRMEEIRERLNQALDSVRKR